MIGLKLTTGDIYYVTEESFTQWKDKPLPSLLVPIEGLMTEKKVAINKRINMAHIVETWNE